ncbi:unnamed protein product [Mesocestoides corti]|uniref:Uncharacterized protein n=1 Tax=Mesocestoides corti TaxID=53468 RepID=A0A0R3U3V6_MESCO|nr:unnamed protein product [Mesocestoides corti]
MWRNWLSKSPTPSQHADERARSATLPRAQTQTTSGSPPRSSSSKPSRESSATRKKGPFDFLRPTRWRTLSRSRRSSPQPTQSVASEDACQKDSSGSTTPTNTETRPSGLPLCSQDTISLATDPGEPTPKSEDANKSLKAALTANQNTVTGVTPSQSHVSKRLSRKDLSREQTRQHTLRPSFFHFAKKTTENTHGQTVSHPVRSVFTSRGDY